MLDLLDVLWMLLEWTGLLIDRLVGSLVGTLVGCCDWLVRWFLLDRRFVGRFVEDFINMSYFETAFEHDNITIII